MYYWPFWKFKNTHIHTRTLTWHFTPLNRHQDIASATSRAPAKVEESEMQKKIYFSKPLTLLSLVYILSLYIFSIWLYFLNNKPLVIIPYFPAFWAASADEFPCFLSRSCCGPSHGCKTSHILKTNLLPHMRFQAACVGPLDKCS